MLEWMKQPGNGGMIQIIMSSLLFVAAVLTGVVLSGMNKRNQQEMGRQLFAIQIFIAVLCSADSFLVLRWIAAFGQSAWGWERFWAEIILGIAGVIFGLLLWWKNISYMPDVSGRLIGADQGQKKKWRRCLFHIWCCFAVFTVWLGYQTVRMQNEVSLNRAGQGTALLFSVFVGIMLFAYARSSTAALMSRMETLVDQKYQEELLNFMQVIRSQRHDFNFHMQAVAGMIDNGKYEECSQYVRTMVRNVEHLNDMLPLHHPANSALVNTFFELAVSKGIRLEIQILDSLQHLPCTVYEMNTVIGNLLQNAIDETETKDVSERWIKLLIMKRSRRYIVKVSNPCEKKPEEFKEIFNSGYSTKKCHEGIGLVNVKKITAKYHGTVYLEHEPGIVHFIAKIPVGM